MDKRVIKTRQNIKSAFMQLTLEKESAKLAVSDIAEKAGINRSTFYLHYADIPAIAEDIYKEFADGIAVCVDNFDISDIHGSIHGIFTHLTDTLDKNKIKKDYLIYSTEAIDITGKLKLTIAEKAANAICSAFPEISKDALTVPLTYAAAGIVESYTGWVRRYKDEKSFDELINKVGDITNYILENITPKNRF